jgi:PAS domain S-box-containing protein
MKKRRTYREIEKELDEIKELGEEYFKQLIVSSFDMLVLLDENGVQKYVSNSCEKLLGYTPDELMNIPVIDEMLHPDDRVKTRNALQDIIENRSNGGAQYRHKHKNGDWIYLEAFGTNQLANPFIRSVVLNVRDVTERKNIEHDLKVSRERLKDLNATKDRLFSVIGHDLRSPLSSIAGFSALLVDRLHSQNLKDVEEYATIIRDSSKRAMDLLTNLLEWSRTQAGKIEFNPEYLELVSIIDAETDLFNDAAQQKNITFQFDLPHNLYVYADRVMISSVIRNLVSNALKFTYPEGTISIHAERDEKEILLTVTDDGMGMSDEKAGNLFRIDRNNSSPGTDNEQGTGLGLLLCKEFIEMHGGKIWAEPAVEQGSVFKFTIPVREITNN